MGMGEAYDIHNHLLGCDTARRMGEDMGSPLGSVNSITCWYDSVYLSDQ
jgi:hypothetical protein